MSHSTTRAWATVLDLSADARDDLDLLTRHGEVLAIAYRRLASLDLETISPDFASLGTAESLRFSDCERRHQEATPSAESGHEGRGS